MVQAPGEAARSRGIRRLNVPQVVEVQTDPSSRVPRTLKERGGRWIGVASLEDSWRVEDEWWREVPLMRTYYQAYLDDGRSLTLFLDEMAGQWHTIRVSEQPRSA
jgi:hypothetical protein